MTLRKPSTRLVAVVALGIAALVMVRLLAEFDWDPTAFAAFGEEATETLEYAEEKLGREVVTRPAQGHDGKFFFVQSNDPWVLDPEENAIVLDRAVYRSQRMFYPVVVSAGGLLPPDALIWTLIAVNVIALAVGSWAVAEIGVRHGVSAWVGLAFVLNVGLMTEMFIDGAGIVAYALACLGALALEKKRPGLAAAAFAAAVLAREVMVLFVAFIALLWLIRFKRVPWSISIPPAIAVIAWAIYIRVQITFEQDVAQVKEITPIPFSGVVDAFSTGLATTLDILVIILLLSLAVIVPMRALRSSTFLTWGSAGFAILAPFLTVVVWQRTFDITRALAPLVTAFVIELLISRKADQVAESITT